MLVPSELAIGDVFVSPWLLSAMLGLFAAWLTGQRLNKLRWSRFVVAPPLVLIAISVIYTVLISTFLIPA
jgi:hypothetical protein